MNNVVWKYIDSSTSTVKHAFYSEKHYVSICGSAPVWYGGSWENNYEKLNRLRECGNCLRVLASNTRNSV